MKIIQIIPALSSGGGERFTVDLSNELHKQGHEVILCTLFDIEEEEIWKFYKSDIHPNIKLHNLKKKLGFDLSMYQKLYQFIKENQPDIVHSHLAVLKYIPLAVLRLNKKIKFFHTLHNDASKLISGKIEYHLTKYLYKNYIQPVCISEESLKSYIELYNLHNAKLILNGRKAIQKTPDFEEVEEYINQIKTKGYKVILNIGRLDAQKNQSELIRAVNTINKLSKRIHLLILGEGTEEFKKKITDQIIDDSVTLLGVKRNVSDYLFLSDAFILSSIYEGMPISLIEAFCAGCLPITTAVGGIRSMIQEGKNGLLIERTDATSIDQTLEKYLSVSEIDRLAMQNQAKSDYQQLYSIETCTQNYIKIYNEN